MADDYTELNKGMGGDFMDEVAIDYSCPPTPRKRPKVVITGVARDEVAVVANTPPAGDAYGLVTRPVQSPYPGTPVVLLQETTLVASGSETTVASYTVPVGKTFYLLGFVASGDVHACYKLYLEADAKLAARSSVAEPTVHISFAYAVFSAAAGETVRLKVAHASTGILGNFEGTIVGYIV